MTGQVDISDVTGVWWRYGDGEVRVETNRDLTEDEFQELKAAMLRGEINWPQVPPPEDEWMETVENAIISYAKGINWKTAIPVVVVMVIVLIVGFSAGYVAGTY